MKKILKDLSKLIAEKKAIEEQIHDLRKDLEKTMEDEGIEKVKGEGVSAYYVEGSRKSVASQKDIEGSKVLIEMLDEAMLVGLIKESTFKSLTVRAVKND